MIEPKHDREPAGLLIRESRPSDVDALFALRGRTRENPIPRAVLERHGITAETWGAALESGEERGWVCMDGETLAGYSQAHGERGEVVVLAVAPEYEGRGIGRALLRRAVDWLRSRGCARIWLGADPNPAIRAHGFYRALGWRPTGEKHGYGDEVLVLAEHDARS